MLVNIEELSAEELFELAQKKKSEEADAARRAAVQERVNEARKRREQIVREFDQALAANDQELQALQKAREQLITRHRAALAVIDKNLSDLEKESAAAVAVPAAAAKPVAAAAPPPTPAAAVPPAPRPPARAETSENLPEAIMELLVGRNTISESLIKEQLRLRGLNTSDLSKVLDKLTREGRLVNRGSGNYGPGKKR